MPKVTPDEVELYYELDKQIKDLTKQQNALKERIKKDFPPSDKPVVVDYNGETYIVNNAKTIGTLNKPLFIREYPPEDFPELYEAVPSTDKIKDAFEDSRADLYTSGSRLSIQKAS